MRVDLAANDLLRELKSLRKGFGLEDPSALERVGPVLRSLAGVTAADGPAEQRRKVRRFLLKLSDTLPENLARASRRALALENAEAMRFESRLRQMADELGRDPRTVRNNVDDALRILAEEAVVAPAEVFTDFDAPWRLDRLNALVRVDVAGIEVLEQRHIVSRREGLEQIIQSYSVPSSSFEGLPVGVDRPRADVLSGGMREDCERWSATRTGIRIRLPRPLRNGQGHYVTTRATLKGPVRFYVCTPRHPCTRFELTVRFEPGAIPCALWLIENEFPLEVEDLSLHRDQAALDEAGEATVSFTGLETGRSYGFTWSPSPDWSTLRPRPV